MNWIWILCLQARLLDWKPEVLETKTRRQTGQVKAVTSYREIFGIELPLMSPPQAKLDKASRASSPATSASTTPSRYPPQIFHYLFLHLSDWSRLRRGPTQDNSGVFGQILNLLANPLSFVKIQTLIRYPMRKFQLKVGKTVRSHFWD